MAYGMPAYQRGGVAEVAFASQEQCVSLYAMRGDVHNAFAERPVGQGVGKSCLRFRRPGSVDLGLVRDLLRATAPPPARPPSNPATPPPPVYPPPPAYPAHTPPPPAPSLTPSK